MLNQIIRLIVFTGVVLIGTGCISYQGAADLSISKEKALKRVDREIKQNFHGFGETAVAAVGATTDRITLLDYSIRNIQAYGQATSVRYSGNLTVHQWNDVEIVTINSLWVGVAFCGILDPSMGSSVVIKFKDGSSSEYLTFGSSGFAPFCETMFYVIPGLWLVNPQWLRADKFGTALQTIVGTRDEKTNAMGRAFNE